MNIAILSLRNKIKYDKLMHNIGGMDIFSICLKYFVENNKKYNFGYYNFTFDSFVPTDKRVLKNSDVIIIPAIKEFLYFTGAIHGEYCKRTQLKLRSLYRYLRNKHLIMLSIDTAVNKELLMNYSFEGKVKPASFHEISSNDFEMGLQGLRYHFIKTSLKEDETSFSLLDNSEKEYDFIYWGSDKKRGVKGRSKDNRHEVIRDIQASNKIKTFIAGRWPKHTKINVDIKWRPMRELVFTLQKGISTICWNWINQRALTARYQEAIACDIFPFVWKDFDSDNRLVFSKFQRVHSIEEYFSKLKTVKKKPAYLKRAKSSFIKNLPSQEDYLKAFDRKVKRILRRT